MAIDVARSLNRSGRFDCPRFSANRSSEAHIAEPFAERIIPASPSLGFLTNFFEDSCALKRFQREAGVVGLRSPLRNRYRGGIVTILHFFLFQIWWL